MSDNFNDVVWVVEFADGTQRPIERPVTPEEFQSPPRQSPRRRLSESEEVSGGNALWNLVALEENYARDLVAREMPSALSDWEPLSTAMVSEIFGVPDFAAGVPLNNVDEAVIRRISEGERDRNGNLIWLRSNGERR